MENEHVQRLFMRTVYRVLSDIRQRLEPDSTLPQLHLLDLLQQHGPLRISDLAERMRVSAGAVTLQSDRLIKLALIERTRSETDRRVVYVTITERGREHVATAREQVYATTQLYFDRLDGPDIQALEQILLKMSTEEGP